MEEIKQIVGMIIKEFQTAEVGNKVTENNMMGLQFKINMALDGKITLKKPEEAEDKKE